MVCEFPLGEDRRMSQLFGTDGIRGLANVEPLTPELAMVLGGALVREIRREGKQGPVVVFLGKDPRLSSDMLEHALAAGVASMGGHAHLLGVLPTPAVAYLTQSQGGDAGVVISASHNPFFDNGIKIFGSSGYKLSDEQEDQIERWLEEGLPRVRPQGRDVGRIVWRLDGPRLYAEFLKSAVSEGLDLSGLRIAVDCANGASSGLLPSVLESFGAQVIPINAEPDGLNINDECGSLHPEAVARVVREVGADLGLSLDGDGDRVLVVDELGNIRDGDYLLAIFARHMLDAGQLANRRVVTTVMANFGLDVLLESLGIELRKTPVGDRYVLEEMGRCGAVLGGEQSGHIIFLNHQTTGDGILSSLKLLEIMTSSGIPLSELASIMEKYPQVLINVPVGERTDPLANPEIHKAVEGAEKTLGDSGRILVRASGTEPLVRVMVEGRDEEMVRQQAERVAEVVRKYLGA
jgi:phosphoglucosamine mutase